MSKLVPQEKIFEFLNTEFSKIKKKHLQQKASKKFKSITIEKKVRQLLNDIELILKTSSTEDDIRAKIMDLKKEIENYFS